ncbi:MAG TPA: MFS transporter [Chloroflexota bacterium]
MAVPRYAAFQSAPFRALWIGMLVSNVGSQMQIVGQGWLVRDISASPVALGLVSLAAAVPMIFLTPIGGAIADRFPRRTLLACTQTGMLFQALVLAALTLAGHIQLWQVIVLAAVNSTLLALDNPTRQALLPDLVTQDQLQSAVSLNAAVWSGSALIGPALGGLLLVPFGPGGLFLINAISYLAVLYALVFLRGVHDRPSQRPDAVLSGVVNGLRYASRDDLTRTVLLLLVVGSLFGRSYQTLMPIFARDVLDVGPAGFGLLLAAPGAGAIVGAFGLAAVRTLRHTDRVMLGGLVCFCLLVLLFTVTRTFAVALVWLLGVGISSTIFIACGSTLLQLHSPRALRGRVMSLATVANIGMSQMGGLLTATLATQVGAPAAVGGAAAVALIVALLIGLAPGWRASAANMQPVPAETQA